MNAYRNSQLSHAQVIDELRTMAAEIASSEKEGNALGLSVEELAFYHALTKPEAVADVYSNDELCRMTKELTEELRKNRTIDWQLKESARARMRVIVKRLLRKYEYPPKGREDALKIVIRQCELWADSDGADVSL